MLKIGNPAVNWEAASPVGNGRLGAMLFGSTDKEMVYLNEETIWSSSPHAPASPDFSEKIDYIRSLLLDGKNVQADEWADSHLSEIWPRIDSYESAGILTITHKTEGVVCNYSRNLDLINGVSLINYTKGGTDFAIECFASHPADLIVYRLKTSKAVDFAVGFEREGGIISCEAQGNVISAHCVTALGEHKFAIAAKILSDGQCSEGCAGFEITNSRETVIYISIATEFRTADYQSKCAEYFNNIRSYDELYSSHTADFSALMKRSDVELEGNKELEDLTVAQRLERLRSDDTEDYQLISLYYQFAKYLMVSSSRPGTLPANLQGVWAEKLSNPWNADYHTNINLQMNYWQAETANIAECCLPLFDYMNEYLLEPGKKTARDYYHAQGTVVHHLSDIYGFTAPADGIWGLWPLGGAWLAYHMWEHYLFGGDRDYLENTAYEYIRQSALFFMDYMFEGPDGTMLTGPSSSPENRYYFGDEAISICLSPTMDTEIIGGLLRLYIAAEAIVARNPEDSKRAESILKKMPDLKVGKHGQLMEWLEDYDEPEPGHRHISHAFGLHPGCQITRAEPQLYEAIKVTLLRRLENGGGHTGWSRAWLINLFARLRLGGEAYDNLVKLLTISTNDNLFDMHPPFQIDGNFGGGAGICEMLLQSHEGVISLLPAVTEGFSGSFKGLRARGGVTVSASFTKGRVTEFSLISEVNQTVSVELPDIQKTSESGGIFKMELPAGKTISVKI